MYDLKDLKRSITQILSSSLVQTDNVYLNDQTRSTENQQKEQFTVSVVGMQFRDVHPRRISNTRHLD